jgi:hypothetical protein
MLALVKAFLVTARVVTGGTRLVSLSKLYAETGWEYLKDRREKHRLTICPKRLPT